MCDDTQPSQTSELQKNTNTQVTNKFELKFIKIMDSWAVKKQPKSSFVEEVTRKNLHHRAVASQSPHLHILQLRITILEMAVMAHWGI